MSGHVTHAILTPAYGRDYTSRVDVLRDFDAGKDFIMHVGPSAGYANNEAFAADATIQFRYGQMRKTFVARRVAGKMVTK